MARKSTAKPQYDVDYIRSAARSRWPEIITALGNVDHDHLDGQHHPCPKCGGTDRFRAFKDFAEVGGMLCNQCHPNKNGDGFSTVQWLRGVKFIEAVGLVADHLGIDPKPVASSNGSGDKKPRKSYATLLEAMTAIRSWMLRKKPERSIEKTATVWQYQNHAGQEVMAVVRFETSQGKEFCPFHVTDSRWFSGDPQGKLPLFSLPTIAAADHIYVCEGEKAAEAGQELGLVTTTAAHGSKSVFRTDWAPLAGKRVTILRDNDDDGIRYANDVRTYLLALTPPATVTIKLLPDLPPKGDLFDFVAFHRLFDTPNEQIVTLIEATEIEDQPASSANPSTATTTAIEHDDDPHRLARINLERYAATADNATIRYWRDEWYTWKPARGCYKKISVEDLRAKLAQTIKQEFDRINIDQQGEAWRDDVPRSQKVTKALVTNVLDATKSLCLVPSSIDLMSWIEGPCRERRNYIAMANGILDLDRLLEDRPADGINDVLLPHSPAWFSVTRLPFKFDPDAKCPRWEKFLERNLELDPERIKILQEWAGYLLLPETGQQRFLALEGEGANGKSVYCAAMTAMLGIDNCSYVSVEGLSDKFVRTQTIGRLVNICPDVGEIEKANEGDLKSFVSGDVMFFDRKHMSGLNCTPTARLMMSFNNRPRFSDRSSGIWRRMMLIPFNVQIPASERVSNMDKHTWWEASGELPGILRWAIAGLHRLRQQGRFTRSALCDEAIADYRSESNPARAFLLECFEESEGSRVKTSTLYGFYKRWTEQNGYRPLGERVFGKEISRVYQNTERKKGGSRGDRYWYYEGIAFSQDEIAGKSTADEEQLF